MTNEIHLYTFGADPFLVPTDGFNIYIHQGAPGSPPPPPPVSPSPAPPTASAGGEPGGILAPTPLDPPYKSYITAPHHSQQLTELLKGMPAGTHDLGLVLDDTDSEAASGGQLRALLDGLADYDGHAVTIHVVSTSALNDRHG